MPRWAAVLFDLDDTLLDYSGPVERCWNAAAERAREAGLDPDAVAAELHAVRRWFWSDPARHARERVDMVGAWTKIAAAALERLDAPSAVLARAIAVDFAARRMTSSTLFADAVPCLRALRARGVPTGLVTNGDAGMQREKIARHGLAPYFDVVVIEGELGTGKPDPVVYRHALAALDADPATTVMIGDNLEWDVVAPRRLGLGGIWIDRAGRGLPGDAALPPTAIVRSLAELDAGS